MKATLRSVPQDQIRNNGVGDWRYFPNQIEALTAEMSDDRSELCVLIHELVEAYLCRKENIPDQEVTAFDALFEEECERELHPEHSEPGDDPRAPYHYQHRISTVIEHAVAAAIGLAWQQHEENIEALLDPEPFGEVCHNMERADQ